MTARKLVLGGCSVALALSVAFVIAFVAIVYGWWSSSDAEPEGIAVAVAYPEQVAAGEAFEIRVEIDNLRPSKPFKLTEIFLDNSYHDGVEILSVDPPEDMRHDMELAVVVLFKYDIEIPAASRQTVTFRCRARDAGVLEGDVMVSEGRKSVLRWIRTEVMAAEEYPVTAEPLQGSDLVGLVIQGGLVTQGGASLTLGFGLQTLQG